MVGITYCDQAGGEDEVAIFFFVLHVVITGKDC